ncbi:hypothetical protein FG386_001335 [Cryptosporidium ryanae]|uniref:uncharacterized protein n=1 Tax=Cryptosporidium ryanae TaxID=515981 RepID=UPI003519EA87|nr:hypothetical protein FG386_001335 [Cryptosporidium ryanae]
MMYGKIDREINSLVKEDYVQKDLRDFGYINNTDAEKVSYMNDIIEMEIDDYCTTHLNTESNTEEDNNNYNNDSSSVDILGNSSEDEGEETIFPVISEPLKTFVTINPATLEDEELWPLRNLKNLCEYIGLSVSGSRKSILNRLQNWNGAPLSGAGHPDSYDTRSGRFHTIPMAYLDEDDLISKQKSKHTGVVLDAINHKIGFNINENDSGNVLLNKDLNSPESLKKPDEINEHKGERATDSESCKGLVDNENLCLNGKFSTPIKGNKNVSSSSSNSNCRSKSKLKSKSAGRICFSPYNHVRVFVPNPGERELNIDPSSLLRLDYDNEEHEYDYIEGHKDVDGDIDIIKNDSLDQ